MKRLLFLLALLPLATFAAEEDSVKKWEGWMIKDCQKFALEELTLGDKGELSSITKGRISEKTKTIYISKQAYLKEVPDSLNGIKLVYIDIDDNLKMLAEAVKKEDAAVFFLSSFELHSQFSHLWVFPIDISGSMFKVKKEYGDNASDMKFFFHYDPPKYYYKGTKTVTME